MMSSPFCRSASRAVRSLLSASKPSRFSSEGRAVAAASALSLYGNLSSITSNYRLAGSKNASRGWLSGVLGLTAAAYMLQEQEAYAAELERTFIAIKPDGVQRGLISEIISRFERKGFKLVAIKIVVPSKEFAQKHYHDLKERPFFNGLCDFLSSGPVIAMVWEGEGVIKYGRKLIGATDPQKSEPGTIRGDLAVVVGRNIIHGSDGPETSKDEINLWFKPEELMAGKPISTEAVALTEKKMDMTLDDIIKMSKNTGTKGKKQPRVLTNKKKVLNNAVKDRSSKAQRFLDSRSSIRQGFLAQRRSHFQDNQFSLATEVARKVAVASHSNGFLGHNRAANSRTPRFGGSLGQRKATNGDFGTTLFPRQQQKQAIVSKERPQTLDSRFANMKEQRMKMLSYVSNNTVRPRGNAVQHNGGFKQRLPWGRGRFAN